MQEKEKTKKANESDVRTSHNLLRIVGFPVGRYGSGGGGCSKRLSPSIGGLLAYFSSTPPLVDGVSVHGSSSVIIIIIRRS